MEPSVRPYNPNGQSEQRSRAARSGRRAQTAIPQKAPSRQKPTLPDAIESPLGADGERQRQEQALGSARAQSGWVEGQGAPRKTGEDGVSPVEEAAGPVVGIDDFEDIFTRFQTPLTNFVFRLVGNREQAYDLTQDVFVKAYKALSSGTTIQAGALSSWLYRIASNTATDALRRRRLISWLPLSLFNEDRGVGAGMPGSDNSNNNQQGPSEENLASATSAFASGYDGGRFEQRVADREIVESVLKRLPPKYATCLLLYEHEGFSCAEIAEVLNVSPSAVKMRLMRARERFITIYQQEVNGQG